MAFSANIHPRRKWTTVNTMLWGPEGGSCVRLVLLDDMDNNFNLTIHYGNEKDKNDFVVMLKEAIATLPVICSECGKPKD